MTKVVSTEYKGLKMMSEHEAHYTANIPQRCAAIKERNASQDAKRSPPRQQVLNDIVHCPHDLDPHCECVRNFKVDTSCLLTERQAKRAAASFERSEMERLKTHYNQQYLMLTNIIKCSEQELDTHIQEYERHYGPLSSEHGLEAHSPAPSHSIYIFDHFMYFGFYFLLLAKMSSSKQR